jgi:hypothetical protein
MHRLVFDVRLRPRQQLHVLLHRPRALAKPRLQRLENKRIRGGRKQTSQQQNSRTPEAYRLYFSMFQSDIDFSNRPLKPLIGLGQGLFCGTQDLEIPLSIKLAHAFCY